MAIQYAEAQTPTPTKLAAAHTPAREFCHTLSSVNRFAFETDAHRT
jgi:hypothetical protein